MIGPALESGLKCGLRWTLCCGGLLPHRRRWARCRHKKLSEPEAGPPGGHLHLHQRCAAGAAGN